jgi:hypothetical protein
LFLTSFVCLLFRCKHLQTRKTNFLLRHSWFTSHTDERKMELSLQNSDKVFKLCSDAETF